MRIIYASNSNQPAKVSILFDYTQWDHEGNEISDAPDYPNPYARVLIHGDSVKQVEETFKARFPNSVTWDSQYI